MALVETRTPSGLYVAENAADYQSVSRALRDYDRDLRLVPQPDDEGRVAYKVFRYQGGDRPAEFVCGWWSEQLQPLPLSHRLVDLVKQLDRNTGGREDVDTENERLREERLRDAAEAISDVGRETSKRVKRSPALHRGQHLRRSRHKPGGRWQS